MLKHLLFSISVCLACSCTSSTISDLIDTIDVPRKTIDVSRLGTNAFTNDSRFGSISAQLTEVRDTLKLKHVRMLFNWDDNVQPSPSAQPNFGFYDALASGIPNGVDAIVVLTDLPSWMTDSGNWTDGNPRTTFVDQWVSKVAKRYASNPRIIGWQIWNEPNTSSNSDNSTMSFVDQPNNYVEMLARAYSVIKDVSPNKRVLNAATTAINQNFPDSVDYNRAMRDAGAVGFVDVWAVHYYGAQFENVVRGDGVADFLNGLSKPIWVTESGAQGVNSQLEYGERAWPFLIDKIPGIERIYQYQFTEASGADVTYGLRNLTAGLEVSDLYIYLRSL